MAEGFSLDIILKKYLKSYAYIFSLLSLNLFSFSFLTRYSILYTCTIIVYLYFLLTYYKILIGFIL